MRPKLEERLPVLQQIELQEYIGSFKSSSDRARYLVYVVTIVSVLISICTWNVSSWSWSRRRLDWAEAPLRERLSAEFAKAHPEPARAKPRESATPNAMPMNWNEARESYIHERVRDDRATKFRQDGLKELLFVPVPGLGVHVDVNDLGLLGGVTLITLTVLLCFSMIRLHENLYLAFFKLRRLCEADRLSHQDGESIANFFYHSLAMGQVLNYPPTLARWGYGFRNKLAAIARWFIFLLPALVQAFVVFSNLGTFTFARDAWGAIAFTRMAIQIMLLAGIVFFCVLTGVYSRACNLRWRAAFDVVNPGLAVIEQRPWRQWLRLPGSGTIDEAYRPVMAELVYSFRPQTPPKELSSVEAIGDMPLSSPDGSFRITQQMVLDMATKVHADALSRLAKVGGGILHSYETTKNTIVGRRWVVTMTCKYANGEGVMSTK